MSKAEQYKLLVKQIDALAKDVSNPISVMANVSSAIHYTMGFFWTGFYIVHGDTLQLGPFQGNIACYNIPRGKGVCGTAFEQRETIIVPDVEKFPGHIACSSLSRSEIVVPIIDDQHNVKAVLDIDSKELNTFDETDKKYLEKIVRFLSSCID